ncbi:aminoacyl-tRNA hydrolase [Thermomicrobium sp. 4228-Ro]|uniref:aminoacyl-tRNA hydrolase n=1 Tax=Thermomicrobium sp. 4228-Ro TaxID=2993937 RepID=UPI002248A133|nr:aminoacyl-tRNA hydrolase [Thermomicrobium sp. 4228-Ro]MCX2726109.1 aminoacyl-tRNA hydrolase [Thermomicrobium sp. 4228-Ro]
MKADGRWLVVGLGNPGPRYARTRHNIGFWVVDRLAVRCHAPRFEQRFDGEFAVVSEGERSLLLLKPLTYMNLSGRSVRQAVQWYKIPLDRLLVVHDDMDLPLGTLRFRFGGSAAGHHGVESVIAELGSDRFGRLRVGIGRPPSPEAGRAYVLEPFTPAERPLAERVADIAAEAVVVWYRDGMTAAMNRFNGMRVVLDQGTLAP